MPLARVQFFSVSLDGFGHIGSMRIGPSAGPQRLDGARKAGLMLA